MATLEGGAALKAKLEELGRRVSKPGNVEVGFLEGATYPDGTSVAMVAAAQEFGTRTIPSRPFFRNAITKDGKSWGEATGKALVASGYNVDATLMLIGDVVKGDVQQSIVDTNEPPLSPRTVARKGFDKPLIDTGHMRNSVDYEVKGEP